jgi:hypothetical protein
MGGGVWIWSCEFGGQLTFACFSGAVLGIFVGFLDDFPFFGHFLGWIFPFLSFFGVRDTVYSRAGGDHVLLPIRESF